MPAGAPTTGSVRSALTRPAARISAQAEFSDAAGVAGYQQHLDLARAAARHGPKVMSVNSTAAHRGQYIERMTENTVNVRYMVDDVAAAVDFYTTNLGFTLQSDAAPAFVSGFRGPLALPPRGQTGRGGGGLGGRPQAWPWGLESGAASGRRSPGGGRPAAGREAGVPQRDRDWSRRQPDL